MPVFPGYLQSLLQMERILLSGHINTYKRTIWNICRIKESEGIYERKDLKFLYKAIIEQAALDALDELERKWGDKYPVAISSWWNKWDNLSNYLKYPEEIRRVIYRTNKIESVHRQFRKLTKTKWGFPNENSLVKLLYMGIFNTHKKWIMPIKNWSIALS